MLGFPIVSVPCSYGLEFALFSEHGRVGSFSALKLSNAGIYSIFSALKSQMLEFRVVSVPH